MEFNSWKEVLNSVKADGPHSDLFYCIKVGDDRSRFMNRDECLEYIQNKIDPKKTLSQFIRDRLT